MLFRNNIDIPPITKNLLIINALFWLASWTLPPITGKLLGHSYDLIELLGLHFVLAKDFNLIQLVSYMFLHDTHSITHLFFNMFSVYMFGRILEQVWGGKRFLIFYFVCGIGAAVVQELMWLYDFRALVFHGATPVDSFGRIYDTSFIYNQAITIGASGAVFGILLGFGMLFPNAPLFLWFIPIPIKAKYFVIGYGVIELFAGVANFRGDNVAHFAHLGGMVFAFLLILWWKRTGKVNQYDG